MIRGEPAAPRARFSSGLAAGTALSPTVFQETCDASGIIPTEESAIQDATPSHIDPDAFRSWLRRPGLDATADPQPDSEDKLRNPPVRAESLTRPQA